MRGDGASCPMCGDGPDEMLQSENSILRKKLGDLTNQFDILEKKNLLQEEVIREQIRVIYDFGLGFDDIILRRKRAINKIAIENKDDTTTETINSRIIKICEFKSKIN